MRPSNQLQAARIAGSHLAVFAAELARLNGTVEAISY
jgi:hypothetical protein